MGNRYLRPLYRYVYGRDFDPDSFEDRVRLQKEIYLLQEKGINAGDYAFMWGRCGPYSQLLQDDTADLPPADGVSSDLKFTDEVRDMLDGLRKMLHAGTQYTLTQRAQCLASLQYLRSRVCGRTAREKEITGELRKRMPYLDNEPENLKALRQLKKYIA